VKSVERDVRALALALAGPDAGHLDLAVAATKLADVATRVARMEVMAARAEGATWAQIADAFGIATQTAHERFRSGPDGLHSRFDLRRQSNSEGTGSRRATSTGVPSATRMRRSTRS
jgi:hypothetical protein